VAEPALGHATDAARHAGAAFAFTGRGVTFVRCLTDGNVCADGLTPDGGAGFAAAKEATTADTATPTTPARTTRPENRRATARNPTAPTR
jgi:hypothetical protein